MEEFLSFVESQKQVTRNKYSTNCHVEYIGKLLVYNITPLIEVHHAIYLISPDPLEYGKIFINKVVYQIVDTNINQVNRTGLFIYNLYN